MARSHSISGQSHRLTIGKSTIDGQAIVFVKNLDREFLPIHTKRVMDLLARIWAVPRDFPWESDNEVDIESQERSIASQDLSYLQNMIHTLEQQSEDREARHAKHLAQFSQEVIGNLGRQE